MRPKTAFRPTLNDSLEGRVLLSAADVRVRPSALVAPAETGAASANSTAGGAIAETASLDRRGPSQAGPVKLPTPPDLHRSPFSWTVTASPLVPVRATDGQYHLEYQLLFVNAKPYAVTLTGAAVLNALTGQPTGNNTAISADGVNIGFKWRLFANQSTYKATDYVTTIGPGQSGVMYLWLTYPTRQSIPRGLTHFFSATATPKPGTTLDFSATENGSTPVSRKGPVAIAPPLVGSGWVDLNGAGPVIFAHRYAVTPVNGALRPQEEFAIDFVQMNSQGQIFHGDPTNVKDYYGYGQPIVSSTAGTVVAAVDGRPDQVPPAQPSLLEYGDLLGNHVVVAFGHGLYADYLHLEPGSVAVKVGQKVRVGQLLGRVGNSGNSTAPHLHFEISDTPSAIDTDSLPFVFKRMYYSGHVVGSPVPLVDELNDDPNITAQIDTTGAGWRRLEMPLQFDVLDFPQPAKSARTKK